MQSTPLKNRISTVVVIIPFYNGSKFIERSLDSVFRQTVLPNEIVVVNDGSKLEERDFLHSLVDRYEIKIVDRENGGQGAARNSGVAESKSEYICFLDQDDFYLENHIELLLDFIPSDSPNFGFAYADLYEADGDGNVIQTGMIKGHSSHPKTNIFDLLRHDLFVLPSASIISRAAYEAVGGFDPQFTGYEDDDLFLRIFRKGYTNHFLDKSVTVWCIHGESTSYSIKMSRSRFKYFKKLLVEFPDSETSRRYFLRDLLMPRFEPLFISDAIRYNLTDHKDRHEINGILAEYTNILEARTAISSLKKLKIRLISMLLIHANGSILRVVQKLVRMPFVNRFASFFLR